MYVPATFPERKKLFQPLHEFKLCLLQLLVTVTVLVKKNALASSMQHTGNEICVIPQLRHKDTMVVTVGNFDVLLS